MAAGDFHALALTEEGELYGWGDASANGHGRVKLTPRRVAALIGQRVQLMDARHDASSAVTEKDELFTWSSDVSYNNLGHGVDTPQATSKRVEGLGGARIASVAIGGYHTLAADEDGVVLAFGWSSALGLDDQDAMSTLRVRVRKSSDVLPFR